MIGWVFIYKCLIRSGFFVRVKQLFRVVLMAHVVSEGVSSNLEFFFSKNFADFLQDFLCLVAFSRLEIFFYLLF
jgi:hypothetical protein